MATKAALQMAPTEHPVADGEAPGADFPYESRYVDVLGSTMHYIEQGSGEVVLFLHGNPTSSYLWRNIIPHVSDQARCIAVDLVGMGKSGHPDIQFTYDDHYRYLTAFIDAMDLGDNITLVVHDWGSMLGLRWASEHSGRVRAVSFMEAMVRPLNYADLPGPLKIAMRMMRNPFFNWLMVGVGNMFLRVMLQDLTHQRMRPEVLAHYRADHPTVKSRAAVRRFPIEVPFNGKPAHNYASVTGYIDWLAKTDLPKLMLHGDDGVAIKQDEIEWCRGLANVEVVDLGSGKHFLQETHPDAIGRALAGWFGRL